LLCAKHLFVAAMVARVHPGLPGTGKNQNVMAGQPNPIFLNGSNGLRFSIDSNFARRVDRLLQLLSREGSNRFAVPLVGNEAAWWKDAGIDPAKAAQKLWNDTRMDQGRIGPGPTAQRPAADRTTNPEQSWKMLMSSLAD
jgi:hypothetical protein